MRSPISSTSTQHRCRRNKTSGKLRNLKKKIIIIEKKRYRFQLSVTISLLIKWTRPPYRFALTIAHTCRSIDYNNKDAEWLFSKKKKKKKYEKRKKKMKEERASGQRVLKEIIRKRIFRRAFWVYKTWPQSPLSFSLSLFLSFSLSLFSFPFCLGYISDY